MLVQAIEAAASGDLLIAPTQTVGTGLSPLRGKVPASPKGSEDGGRGAIQG